MSKKSKKELIVEKAKDSFSRYGYELTTVEAIARECNITKPAVYYHFKDKAALYKAVVCPEFTALAEKIEEHTKKGIPTQRLENYIQTFGAFLVQNPTFSAIFAREIANGSATLPDDCTEQLSRTIRQLISILHTGEKEKVFQVESPFLIQMMIVTPLISCQTTKPLREKIAKFAHNEIIPLEPHFENIVDSLSQKIIKGLLC